MSGYKGQGVEQDVVAYVLNATAMPAYGSASGTELWVSLHTASPTTTGNQTSAEATFGGYARQQISRSTSGWSVTGIAATNASTITFPTATSSNVITYVGIGTSSTGTGELLFAGPLLAAIPVSNGAVVQFNPGQLQLNVSQTTGVSSISNADGTLSISPSNGVVVASLAPLPSAHILIGNASNLAASQVIGGDGTLSNSGSLTVTKTNGVAFAPSATTDTTDASNITAGTLPYTVLPTVGTITPGAYTNTNISVDTYGRIVSITNGTGGGGGSGTVVGTSNQVTVTTSGSTSTISLPNIIDLDASNISGVSTSTFNTNIANNATGTIAGSINICPGYYNGVPSYGGSYFPALASLQGTNTLAAGPDSQATGLGSLKLLSASINTGGSTGSNAVTYTIQPQAVPSSGGLAVSYFCYLPPGNSTAVLYRSASTSHQFVQYIDINGVQNLAQPSFTDLQGFATLSQGGTGVTSLTSNGVTVVNGAGTALNTIAPGANGNVLTSNGTSWVSAAPGTGGITPVTAGGTNTSSLPANGVLVSNSSGTAVQTVAPGTANNVLMSNGSTWSSQSLSTLSPVLKYSVTLPASVIAGLDQTGGGPPHDYPFFSYYGFLNILAVDIQLMSNGTSTGAAFTAGANLEISGYNPTGANLVHYPIPQSYMQQVATAGDPNIATIMFGPQFTATATLLSRLQSSQANQTSIYLTSTSSTHYVVGSCSHVNINIYYILSPTG